MAFKRMALEEWFDTYQYATRFDIGESAVKFLTFDQVDIDLAGHALRYGYHSGRPDLRERIAAQYPGLAPDEIVVTSGGCEAIFALYTALASGGRHVIVEHPNFAPLYEVPRALGCPVTFFELRFEEAFQPDLGRLEALITPQTRLIALTHPNNPTGSMISREALERLARIAEARGLYVLFDETYRDLVPGEPLPPAATLSDRLISVSSMSKCYGLPGIRIGWLASRSKEVRDAVVAVREHITITNASISEEIAEQVLERREVFLSRSREHIRRNFALVSAWMKQQSDLTWVEPEAGVVALPKLRWTDDEGDAERLYRLLAEKYQTFVIPGRCFETHNTFFRLGYGGMPGEIVAGLENLAKAMQDLKNGRAGHAPSEHHLVDARRA